MTSQEEAETSDAVALTSHAAEVTSRVVAMTSRTMTMTSRRAAVTSQVAVAVLLAALVAPAQGCQLVPSVARAAYSDAYCTCADSLDESMGTIDRLVINMTDCDDYQALDISWSKLEETGLKFQHFKLIGSEVQFSPPVEYQWTSSIRTIVFEECTFDTVPGRAFNGLNQLEELRFTNNYINSLDSYAISNLQSLVTLEFAGGFVSNIEPYSISYLPKINELAFIHSEMGNVKNNSIHIIKTPDLPVEDCSGVEARTGDENDRNFVMKEVLGRSLQSIESIPLPKYGPRLLIYRSNISELETSAVESNIFSFLIIAGTEIGYLPHMAFNMDLTNQCEITALMFVQNDLKVIGEEAFAHIKSRLKASHKTYVVLTNNTFDVVEMDSFKFHPSVTVFNVEENQFKCECEKFRWNYYSQLNTQRSNNSSKRDTFDDKIIANASCVYEKRTVTEFLSTCSEVDFVTMEPASAYGDTDTTSEGTHNNVHIQVIMLIICAVFIM